MEQKKNPGGKLAWLGAGLFIAGSAVSGLLMRIAMLSTFGMIAGQSSVSSRNDGLAAPFFLGIIVAFYGLVLWICALLVRNDRTRILRWTHRIVLASAVALCVSGIIIYLSMKFEDYVSASTDAQQLSLEKDVETALENDDWDALQAIWKRCRQVRESKRSYLCTSTGLASASANARADTVFLRLLETEKTKGELSDGWPYDYERRENVFSAMKFAAGEQDHEWLRRLLAASDEATQAAWLWRTIHIERPDLLAVALDAGMSPNIKVQVRDWTPYSPEDGEDSQKIKIHEEWLLEHLLVNKKYDEKTRPYMDLLLAHGADPMLGGAPVFEYALMTENFTVAGQMLPRGFDINGLRTYGYDKMPWLDALIDDGITPEAIRWMLEHGATVRPHLDENDNYRSGEPTLYYFALERCALPRKEETSEELLRRSEAALLALLDHGALINNPDQNGSSPALLASSVGAEWCALLLMKHGGRLESSVDNCKQYCAREYVNEGLRRLKEAMAQSPAMRAYVARHPAVKAELERAAR